jgi:signal transduction histidine kinase
MESPSYALSDIARVVKRHAHDVRNALNGMELELALLDEGTDDLSARAAIKRLRDAGAGIGRLIQALSSKYGLESSCPIPAVQLAERWSAGSRQYAVEIPIAWTISLDRESLYAEPGLIRSLLEDLLDMAIRLNRKKPLHVHCHSKEGRALYEISAPDGQPPNNAVIDAHQPYWIALTHLAERCQGVLSPAKLTAGSSFPMTLSFPVQPA